MKTIDISEMKAIQLSILTDVDRFCRENKLKYYLSGGTMLGAVRHKGFIPWDDDIDIQMPRPDYNRFIQEYEHDHYAARSWDKDPNFLCTYCKVEDTRTQLHENGNFGRELGVNIDVFPVDGLPEDDVRINRLIKKMKILWGFVVCATVIDIKNRRPIKKLEITLMRAFYKVFHLKSYFVGRAIKMAQTYPFNNSSKVATLVWGYGIREVINTRTAVDYFETEFEGHKFYIPKDYDDYLTHIYGNYMELPPIEERVYKHHSTANWK